jgi:hypothetical protein
MRREASRVSFLMCPFCVRAPVSSLTTSLSAEGESAWLGSCCGGSSSNPLPAKILRLLPGENGLTALAWRRPTVRSPAVAVLPDQTTAFEGQLDDAIKAAVTYGAQRLGDVIASVPGAFPSVVAERLDRLSLLSRLSRQTDAELHPQPEPELHPLDYEWYFTPQADSRLTEELRPWPDPIACLGREG